MATNQQGSAAPGSDPAAVLRERVGQAVALADSGDKEGAISALRAVEAALPETAWAWREIGDGWHAIGEAEAGGAAHLKAIEPASRDPELIAAASALAENRLPDAEPRLRAHLKRHPTDVAAIRMLAELAGRIDRHRDAETLLRRAVDLAPGFAPARHNLALLLHRHGNPEEALIHVEQLIGADPDNATYNILKAAILGRIGDYPSAVEMYEAIVAQYPRQAKVWMSLGHALKTLGRQEESIAAYRRSLTLDPGSGSTWWSLANLKTFRFAEADTAAMQGALGRPGLKDDERFQIEFALGKAFEDAGRYAESFAFYADGNRHRRALVDYDAQHVTDIVDRQRRLLTPEFFAERVGWGFEAEDPIFVVSLPRSGSTLIEQILASHSAVEGTMELPDIAMLANRLGQGGLAKLDRETARALGEEYVERTRVQRKEGTPRFVDKMPNNWIYAAFIHLILPNARIVDARRHPLGCGFSLFKQHFARGQSFSYDLSEIGIYYRDYVRGMAHLDRLLPGRVHRIFYENMIEDTEAEIRALLAYCGLDFEAACLRFHENERAVRTASSEQVRRPIFREGLDQWRHYEPWLGPLAEALGPVLECYPDVPPEA